MSKVKDLFRNLREATPAGFWTGFFTCFILLGTAGYAWSQHQQNQMQQRLIDANAEARNWKLAWSEAHNAFEERALQFLDAEQVRERLRERNEQLAEELEDAGNRILALQETKTRLEARLDSSASEVSRTDSTEFTVDLDESVYLQEEGFVRVFGTVKVVTEGPSVETDLGVEGEFPLTVVLSRNDEGGIEVHAFTGDPRLRVKQLDVQRRVEQRQGGGFLEGLNHQLTGFGPWLNRGVGFGVCALLSNSL